MVTSLGSTILRKYLDDVPLWRGDNVAIRQLVDDFARYLCCPALQDLTCCCKRSATAWRS
jgi:hypothetical protein